MAIKRRTKKQVKKQGMCVFCNEGIEPDYKNYKDLARFMSDRARLIGSVYTGVCSKHQRRLTNAIKRARHLGLLPFVPQI